MPNKFFTVGDIKKREHEGLVCEQAANLAEKKIVPEIIISLDDIAFLPRKELSLAMKSIADKIKNIEINKR